MKVVCENNYVHYKCQLNLSSKHSTRLKVEVTHRRAFFSSIAKFAKKKRTDSTLFQRLPHASVALCAHHRHVHIQITACRQMWRGGAKQKLKSKAFSGFWCPADGSSTFDGDLAAFILILPSTPVKLCCHSSLLTAFIISVMALCSGRRGVY